MKEIVFILVLVVLLASAITSLVKFVSGLIGKVSLAIAKAPGKGFKKIVNAIKGHSERKAQAKLDKALMKADYKARLNAARQNVSYRNDKKVAKILRKREIKSLKKTK